MPCNAWNAPIMTIATPAKTMNPTARPLRGGEVVEGDMGFPFAGECGVAETSAGDSESVPGRGHRTNRINRADGFPDRTWFATTRGLAPIEPESRTARAVLPGAGPADAQASRGERRPPIEAHRTRRGATR